jgi:TolB protein
VWQVVAAGAVAISLAGAAPATPRNGLIAFVHGGIATVHADGKSFHQLTRVASDNGPAWSPDGSTLVFARKSMLYVTRADGSHLRPLVRGNPTSAWSPDGKRLAFARNGDLWVVRVDGKGERRLTTGRAEDSDPAWSPRGDRIAFVRVVRGVSSELFVISASGGSPTRVDEGWVTSAPAWAPDGTALAYSLTNRADFDYVTVRDVAAGSSTDFDAPEGKDDCAPAWSSDDRTLVVNRAEEPYDEPCEASLALVDTATGESRDIPGGAQTRFVPAWSPDGKKLVFSDDAYPARGRLRVYDVATGRVKLLGVFGTQPDWAPAR